VTGALAERERRALERAAARAAEPGGEFTLDAMISSAWAGLAWGAPVACPACDGLMRPEPDSNAARCRDCGATLS
jgi:hypothetical protein